MKAVGGLFIVCACALLLLTACGGGSGDGSSSASKGTELLISLSSSEVSSTSPVGAEFMSARASCTGKELFGDACWIESVAVQWGSIAYQVPLNVALKVGESADLVFPVLTDSDRLMEPFSYVQDVNPSTAHTDYTRYTQVIGTIVSQEVARGEELCVESLSVSPASQTVPAGATAVFSVFGGIPPYEVFSSDNLVSPMPATIAIKGGSFSAAAPSGSRNVTFSVRDSVGATSTATLAVQQASTRPATAQATAARAESTTCEPVMHYSFNLPAYTAGTLIVTDGVHRLTEETMGLLSGEGGGTIRRKGTGYVVDLVFSKAPPVRMPIVAYYVPPLTPLEHMPLAGSVRIAYGDLTMSQAGDTLVDGKGDPLLVLRERTLVPVKPLGFRNAAVVAMYEGEPYNAAGGETVGHGNGILRTFAVSTRYAPVVQGSLRVFTSDQEGRISSAAESTGQFVVTFDRPPLARQPIKTSYVLSAATALVNLTFRTSNGDKTFQALVEVKRK